MSFEELKDAMVDLDGWQEDWPTEPGTLWWFHGSRWGESRHVPPKDAGLHVVLVAAMGKGVCYVSDGSFVYPQKGGEGKWKRLIPVFPQETP